MISRWLARAAGIALLVATGACGNYSNDDLDFQLALPNSNEMQASLSVSVMRADSAEYYKETRKAVIVFNTIIDEVNRLIDVVRGYPPTSRSGNQRTWGPFPSDKYPNEWDLRVVMTRSVESSTFLRMRYAVELHPRGGDAAAWTPYLTGSYLSQGTARTGIGDIHLLAGAARAAGYPVNDDPGQVELDHLDIAYDNASEPKVITLTITNIATASTRVGSYDYRQASDGTGSLTFDWRGTTDTNMQLHARINSRWRGDGAGRADLVVLDAPNLPLPVTWGTDCWGADTVATYTWRVQGPVTTGNPATCVF